MRTRPCRILIATLAFLLVLGCPATGQSLPDVVDELLAQRVSVPVRSAHDVLFPWYPVSDVPLSIPSGSLEKVFHACQKRPELYAAALGRLPEREEVYRELLLHAGDDPNVREYLRRRMPSLEEELVAAAELTVSSWNSADLEALARRDYTRASPIVKRLAQANNDGLKALARRLAAQYGSSQEALRAFVLDPNEPKEQRERAAAELWTDRWPGDQEALEKLFAEDEAWRFDTEELETMQWTPVLFVLLKSTNGSVRGRAADLLLRTESVSQLDLALSMLPWLEDEHWVDGSPPWRIRFIHTFWSLRMPEAVPGLRKILVSGTDPIEIGAAARALVFQLGPEARAIISPPSREQERLSDDYREALLQTGDLTPSQIVDAIEVAARAHMRGELQKSGFDSDLSWWVRFRAEPIAGLMQAIAARVALLDEVDPAVSKALSDEAMDIRGLPADDWCVERLLDGKATAVMVTHLLTSDDFQPPRIQTPHGELSGIWASFDSEERLRAQVVSGTDTDAQRALLAAARVQNRELPIAFVSRSLAHRDLRDAALAYIQSSPSLSIRDLLPRTEAHDRVLGTGPTLPDKAEQELLQKLPPDGSALLLRKLERGGRWELQDLGVESYSGEAISVIISNANAPAEHNDLLDFLDKNSVETWPRFVWPFLEGVAENYRLTVVTRARMWRTDFHLMPRRIENDRVYTRFSQQEHRRLVDLFEAAGQWESFQAETDAPKQ